MKARKRPAAALVVAGGAVLALLAPGTAVAAGGAEVSGGYVSWSTAELAGAGLTLTGGTGSAGRTWFRAGGGAVDGTDARVELAGTAAFGAADRPALPLAELSLTLDDGTGTLHARQPGADRPEFALAAVRQGDTAPVVRDTGATWTGLRAALTEEGAALLSGWSGREFTAGDPLGLLDVTVGTGDGTPEPPPPAQGGTGETPAAPPPTPDAPEPPAAGAPDLDTGGPPAATVAHPALTAGGEQRVTGTGFTPGAVVLVAIDGDTRYQAVADERGRVERAFPVYTNAVAGEHTAELTPVTGGGGGALARFEVRSPD
ncbi:HtaA domain-containing protein [Streptomyces sp. NPDC004610]|uniref:HtaA domain-containing protein n=1 Tax=unclassified Streptomyces TaxID=2593676 RepID=UPI0033A35E9F